MLTKKRSGKSSKTDKPRKFANAVCAFRPSDEALALIEAAAQITRLPKSVIFNDCLVAELPRFIAANKPQKSLRVNRELHPSGK